jgi:hypothetical protein
MSDNTAQNLAAEAPAEEPKHTARARRTRKHHDAGPEHVSGAVQEVLAQAQERQPGDDGETEKSHAAGVEKKPYKPSPDPFGGHIITLSHDGLKGRILRDKQYGKMLIQFTKNPGAEFTSQIAKDGFDWKKHVETDFAKGAWVLDLVEGQEWRGHAHAEKVFQGIINQIREKNGMEPWVPGAGQAAPF